MVAESDAQASLDNWLKSDDAASAVRDVVSSVGSDVDGLQECDLEPFPKLQTNHRLLEWFPGDIIKQAQKIASMDSKHAHVGRIHKAASIVFEQAAKCIGHAGHFS